jgi:hypothetical protein
MHRHYRVISAAVALTMAAAGCSAKPPDIVADSPAPAVSAGPVTGSTPPPDDARLGSALLGPADLPGYVQSPLQTSPVAGMGSSMTQCAGQNDPSATGSQARVMLQAGPTGPFFGETLMAMSEADATRLVRGLTQVTKNCGSFDGGSPGGMKFDVAIGHLTFPRVGDDTAAFRMTATVEQAGAAVYAHVVAVRRGGLVLLLVLMQFDSPEVSGTEDLVRRAYAKAATV